MTDKEIAQLDADLKRELMRRNTLMDAFAATAIRWLASEVLGRMQKDPESVPHNLRQAAELLSEAD